MNLHHRKATMGLSLRTRQDSATPDSAAYH
jgi:hypothetical protein